MSCMPTGCACKSSCAVGLLLSPTWLSPVWLQIQAELGEGHINVINAKEVILTHSHLALSLEYAACGSLTSYVAEKWQHAQYSGLFLSEDEARYFMRVSGCNEPLLSDCLGWLVLGGAASQLPVGRNCCLRSFAVLMLYLVSRLIRLM